MYNVTAVCYYDVARKQVHDLENTCFDVVKKDADYLVKRTCLEHGLNVTNTALWEAGVWMEPSKEECWSRRQVDAGTQEHGHVSISHWSMDAAEVAADDLGGEYRCQQCGKEGSEDHGLYESVAHHVRLDIPRYVNTTPNPRTFNTTAHVNFSRVAQDLSHQVSSECLCLIKQSSSHVARHVSRAVFVVLLLDLFCTFHSHSKSDVLLVPFTWR